MFKKKNNEKKESLMRQLNDITEMIKFDESEINRMIENGTDEANIEGMRKQLHRDRWIYVNIKNELINA